MPRDDNFKEALKELKDCQAKHKITSCFLCDDAVGCDKKESFEDLVMRNLDTKIHSLQDCQREHNIRSCSVCKELLNCEIRNAYVDAVYLSMNKGSGGSFEF
ncbi:hypothetical protein LS72_005560 [Helicobacter apodemus]|uniref:Uncharacterized protein n=1 Tax=Helicobacter apodemus TaxID=135569 RepID=A0A4U8UFA8_9HELI|nr:hypothetical protein [Helicobacter apodemus]MDE6958704.1 hypothetical protein [Helicobacter apodemus]TLE15857.1 hypothetical protein LS72_005560 [Helicobacter apodemus]